MAQEDTFLPASQAPASLLRELSGAGGWLRRRARRLVLSRLEALEVGRLDVVEEGERLGFGRASDAFPVTGEVVVEDGDFWERLAWGGSIGAGEAFCDGLWSSPDLTSVVRVLARNQQVLQSMERGPARLAAPLRRLLHLVRNNSPAGSRRNIAAHYDAGNELFAQFLDPTLTYSCAIFPDVLTRLDAAQQWKLETICRKLELTPQDRLVEIGTGWGGLAVHAARKYGCRVVTTTISRRQFDYASRVVAEAGVADRVEVLLADYRELPARFPLGFNKLASIEMIEAVGHAWLPRYLRTVADLLAPQGAALLQAILVPDQRYEAYRRSVDFIQRHVFPGGLLPSLARIQECTARWTDLRLVDFEDLTPHYARTLDAWRRRFTANESRIAALGLSASERRKWKYYFGYCEGGFHERTVLNGQLLLAKPEYRRQARPATLY